MTPLMGVILSWLFRDTLWQADRGKWWIGSTSCIAQASPSRLYLIKSFVSARGDIHGMRNIGDPEVTPGRAVDLSLSLIYTHLGSWTVICLSQWGLKGNLHVGKCPSVMGMKHWPYKFLIWNEGHNVSVVPGKAGYTSDNVFYILHPVYDLSPLSNPSRGSGLAVKTNIQNSVYLLSPASISTLVFGKRK